MAATANLLGYRSSATVTCSLASLATGSARESAVYTNSTNTTVEDFNAWVAVTFTLASGSPVTATLPVVNFYANGSVDGTLWPIIQLSSGATYTTGAGDASVGALSSAITSQLRLIGVFGIQTTTTSAERTFRTQPMSVGLAFDDLPEAFSVMVENQTGVAFSTSTVSTANLVEVLAYHTTSGN